MKKKLIVLVLFLISSVFFLVLVTIMVNIVLLPLIQGKTGTIFGLLFLIIFSIMLFGLGGYSYRFFQIFYDEVIYLALSDTEFLFKKFPSRKQEFHIQNIKSAELKFRTAILSTKGGYLKLILHTTDGDQCAFGFQLRRKIIGGLDSRSKEKIEAAKTLIQLLKSHDKIGREGDLQILEFDCGS